MDAYCVHYNLLGHLMVEFFVLHPNISNFPTNKPPPCVQLHTSIQGNSPYNIGDSVFLGSGNFGVIGVVGLPLVLNGNRLSSKPVALAPVDPMVLSATIITFKILELVNINLGDLEGLNPIFITSWNHCVVLIRDLVCPMQEGCVVNFPASFADDPLPDAS
ncbi:hypothetical protein IEQ34_007864 [Dendrobium chrysotoxum]|uniref:Uncharacterized protein n=1 Tax=Dendrobium chrysotoxum TaxID=161865 RepID=A0AAV7H4N3_DENCH|nr:hypothetical protein IEQ34_007864 [Dendrobium chrysotoxum]